MWIRMQYFRWHGLFHVKATKTGEKIPKVDTVADSEYQVGV